MATDATARSSVELPVTVMEPLMYAFRVGASMVTNGAAVSTTPPSPNGALQVEAVRAMIHTMAARVLFLFDCTVFSIVCSRCEPIESCATHFVYRRKNRYSKERIFKIQYTTLRRICRCRQ